MRSRAKLIQTFTQIKRNQIQLEIEDPQVWKFPCRATKVQCSP